MKRKVMITLLTVSMICLSACGKADNTEEVMSSAIETDDQQEIEEENIVDEVENIIDDEPEQEVEEENIVAEVDTTWEDVEVDTTSLGNGAGEQITTQEEDYFKEAEELWEQYSEQMDVNWETFRETYTTERKDNGLSQQQALDKLLDLFKPAPVVEEQPQQQPSQSSTSTQTEAPAQSTQGQSSNNSGQKYDPEILKQLGITGGTPGGFGSNMDIREVDPNTPIDSSGLEGITAE